MHGPDSEPGPSPANLCSEGGSAAKMSAMRRDFLGFFDAEYPLVVRFLMRTGASLPDAEDATQRMFETGWRKVQRCEWDQIAHPGAWARKVALNHYHARPGCGGEVPLGADIDRTAPGLGHADLTDQARDLITLLHRLEEDCRMVFALRLDCIPGPEIAAMLNLPEQRVRDLYKRARRDLRKLWEGGQW